VRQVFGSNFWLPLIWGDRLVGTDETYLLCTLKGNQSSFQLVNVPCTPNTTLESFRVLERVVSPACLDRISESLPLRKWAGVWPPDGEDDEMTPLKIMRRKQTVSRMRNRELGIRIRLARCTR
jgi:hypothetical protein